MQMEPFLLSWYASLIFSLCILFTSIDIYVHQRVALPKIKHEVLKFNHFEKNTVMVHTEIMSIYVQYSAVKLSCQPRVIVTSYFVYKVIRDLE